MGHMGTGGQGSSGVNKLPFMFPGSCVTSLTCNEGKVAGRMSSVDISQCVYQIRPAVLPGETERVKLHKHP